MKLLADVFVALVALLHVYFLVLEMFLWDKPLGLKTFRHSAAEAAASKVLAANQGLYNGFLAAGLAWGLSLGAAGTSVKVFFLACVIVAGVYGAATVGAAAVGATSARKVAIARCRWLPSSCTSGTARRQAIRPKQSWSTWLCTVMLRAMPWTTIDSG